MAKGIKDNITTDQTIAAARRVLEIEAAAVRDLIGRLDENFIKAVDLILAVTGKVVVTGMGKSGLICQKIASTLASTGTSALFLHPAEGAHGDLGILARGDLLIAISNSGETEEIVKMLPVVKRMGIPVVAMTGKGGSTLSRYAEVTIDVSVGEEACPMGLAPTASTTATLAMGDALSVVLLERRGFREEDFAILHPAGSLGRKLMKVEELMHSGDAIPVVSPDDAMKDAILVMTAKRLGLTGVFKGSGEDKELVGVLTDGDLRRALEQGANVFEKSVSDLMCHEPKLIAHSALVGTALNLMEEHSITALFVCKARSEGGGRAGVTGCGENPVIVGVVHLHDLIKAGVV